MSDVVGSTPSFTRNGRPSASLSRSSSSLMICAAPCFKNARASSGCIVNHRIAHPAIALLVFIQQLAHLLDRERRILSVERFLTLTLVQKRPIPCIREGANLFVGLRCVADAARSLICVSGSRISHCLLRGSVERVASAVESLRIELPRQEGIYPQKTLRIGFFLDIKRTDGGLLIDRYSIRDEFFVLCVILQVHVRLEQAIHQLSLLFLTADARESSHK